MNFKFFLFVFLESIIALISKKFDLKNILSPCIANISSEFSNIKIFF